MIEQVGYDRVAVGKAIATYERVYPTGPDSIAASILSYKKELQEMELSRQVDVKTGVIGKSETNRRMKMIMPSGLYMALSRKFPTLFKADFKKFERDFPVFFKGWKT